MFGGGESDPVQHNVGWQEELQPKEREGGKTRADKLKERRKKEAGLETTGLSKLTFNKKTTDNVWS